MYKLKIFIVYYDLLKKQLEINYALYVIYWSVIDMHIKNENKK